MYYNFVNSYKYEIAFEFFSHSDLFIITEAKEFNDLKEKNLFKIPFVEINKILCVMDPSSKVTDAGVISLKYGIGTYLEDSEEDTCESIIIFKKDYYAPLCSLPRTRQGVSVCPR